MKVSYRKEEPEEPEETYRLGDYGVLIQLTPHQEQYVKECREGRMVKKSECGGAPFLRDASGNYFYLVKGETLPHQDDLIPSRWDEIKEN